MKGYVEQLERLGYVLPQDLSVGLFMNGLTSDFAGFVRNYNMHNIGKKIGELHALLIEYKKGSPKKAAIPQVMAIQGGRIHKANKKSLNKEGRSKLTLPVLQDYALESATRILNMVPTKKVDKTPYELWYGKVPNLSYLKVWGCEAFVKRDMPENSNNDLYAEFFEKNLISQEVSGRAVELEEIQDEDTSPSENTSEIPMEVEGFEPPQEEVVPVRRSIRTHRAPDCLCLNVEVEKHSIWDLNKPANYKAAILDPKFDKWLDAMNAEMQSMKDNQLWCLVDLPPNGFINPKHHIKVCKLQISIYGLKQALRSCNKRFDEQIKKFGFAQNLDEPCVYQKASGSNVTFLILYVDDIIIMRNHIPSLQSVKSYLEKCFAIKDLRKAAFILGIKIYRDRSKRLIGVSQSAYMDKILKRYRMDNSKRRNIPMQERLDLNKTQGALTPGEVKHMKNVPYASTVGSIIFETNRDDIKSQTGYVFILNGGALDWKSSKKSTTVMSATEAEYIAASEAAMEAVWIRKFISGL
ncbi:retrotransposon protein, putative, ty1-copia subclass, partial [Tanacetum coccineum]